MRLPCDQASFSCISQAGLLSKASIVEVAHCKPSPAAKHLITCTAESPFPHSTRITREHSKTTLLAATYAIGAKRGESLIWKIKSSHKEERKHMQKAEARMTPKEHAQHRASLL